ncbi:AT-hook motif nuclear-localized protein 2 [Sesamum angolense]|uniref:AT-hook motif nuclear-localized protein n=1 Tax=Sesamum angolense TaxID=2727404 RepID=A0AAE2C4Q5_9LAMI|nr:AT-hook motif nuclear-localized protein 2 [Sesamum angolense]
MHEISAVASSSFHNCASKMESENAVSQHAAAAAAAETEVEVSVDDVEVVVTADEKLENEGGGDEERAVAVSVARAEEAVFPAKRKRGRPRKQQPVEAAAQQFMPVPAHSATPEKRGRGRPKGSGMWQSRVASCGGINPADTAGSNFTPHTITVQAGENIVQTLWSFSQSIPDSVCVLSASGTISIAEILMPASRVVFLNTRQEGHFTLIHLNGSHTYDENRGGKVCLLSVQLSNADGRFYGGAVAGSLIAAGPIQLIIGTFTQKLRHEENQRPQRFASPNPREAIAPGPSQTDQKRKTADAKAKGALVIDPPIVPDAPPVTDEVAKQKGKAPAHGHAAPQPSSARAATSDDAEGAEDEE